MLTVFDSFHKGYNEISNMVNNHPDMLMDIGIQLIDAGETLSFYEEEKETAFLLLNGEVMFQWEQQTVEAARHSLFDENPVALHVPYGTKVVVTAKDKVELLIQKTTNTGHFQPKYYSQSEIGTEIFGENVWNDTARRLCRTVFDYNNAPYSNMVMGELINYPGRWSSYIPHGHDQPEVYFYRFDKDSGFGAAFLGDEVFKIQNNSAFYIPGGPTHPQVSAPGYAMYYCWLIRHLDNNPWTSRDNDQRYSWLLEKDVVIWPDKK